jgi:hypothetical protein
MDWKPKARILADRAESEPSKPSKPGFVGFEGTSYSSSPEIVAVRGPALTKTGWLPKGKPYEVWKAEELNRMFIEQGATRKAGQISAATVRQGWARLGNVPERKARK